jgi:CheY-like chemotaxis protein
MNNAFRSPILPRCRLDNLEPVPVTTLLPARPSALADARSTTSELNDQVKIRVNEGVAGVEDEAVIAMLLAEVLAGMGHDVCAIEATEADAVAAAARCRPDMMILDARLGDGSGISAVEQILCTGFIPHVFVSGDALRVRALRPGAVVIQKPFHEADLASAMQRALGVAAAS